MRRKLPALLELEFSLTTAHEGFILKRGKHDGYLHIFLHTFYVLV